ncbi:MAG TPA: ATP-dependent zinc metalloprotease FtsH [Eubacteriales bacterium]|nr:ATP-dependent zinc metalloprotease FtsH [Eubacteriales bacterium]
MNKKVMTAIIWVMLFVAIIFMVSGLNPSEDKPDELDYNTDFLQLVRNTEEGSSAAGETIKAIQVDQRQVYGLYGDSEDELSDLPKKADFYVVIPSESTFRSDMAAIVYAADPDAYTSVDEVSSADYSFAYESTIVEESIWSIILPYILIFAAFGVFYYFMIRAQSGGKQMTNFGKSRARLQSGDKLNVTFADVAGADEEKEELKEVVEFMRNPARFNAIGARIPKGVLLVGPPGTGKTLLAKAVAGEAKVPFFSISGSDFVEMFVGVGASRVRDLFQTAKRATPAVVFIDEIDAVGRHRGAGLGGGHDEREQTLNQLLVEMDGFAPNEGIIVIAATNRPDILDPALLRPGRFDRRITVNYPDVKGREEILKVHARNKPLAPDVELAVLAKRTPGFTGADLENVLNEAAILTARANKKKIGMIEMEEAITRVQMGPEKRSRVITEGDKRITAYHEAGHAIVALRLEGCDPVHEVSIVPRGMAAGYTMYLPKEDMLHVTKNKLLDRIAMALGGRVAEQLKFDDVSTGAYNDLQRSSEIAHKMVTEYGMSDSVGPMFLGGQEEVFIAKDWGHQRNYSESLAATVDEEVRRILDGQYERARAVISESMEALDRLANMLIEYERVSGEEFAAVYEGADPAEVLAKRKKKAPAKRAAKPQKAAETDTGLPQDLPNGETADNPLGQA